ncbi:MAG: glycosyltransferase family 87 protein [Candidatus Hinthialibacter sp.]
MKQFFPRWIYSHWAAALAGIGWILWDMPFVILVLPTDFDYYFKAALRLAAGTNIYYDWMAESVREGISSWYLYPPYFAGALTPLTHLGLIQAKIVFACLTVLALIGVDALLVLFRRRHFPQQSSLDWMIHALVFFTPPTHLAIGSLQVEGILLFLFLLMLYFVEGRRSAWLIGAAFAPGVLIKLWPGPYLASLWLVCGRRIWAPVIVLGLGFILGFTVFFGWRPQWEYVHMILPDLMGYSDPYKDNQSLSLFLLQIGSLSETSVRLARWAILASYFAATYASRRALRAGDTRAIVINASLFLCVSLLVTPTAWTASHLRLLPPMILAGGLCASREPMQKAMLVMTFLSMMFYIYPQELCKKILPVWLDRYPVLYSLVLLFIIFSVLTYKTGVWERSSSQTPGKS